MSSWDALWMPVGKLEGIGGYKEMIEWQGMQKSFSHMLAAKREPRM